MDYAAEQLETTSLIKILLLIVGCFKLRFFSFALSLAFIVRTGFAMYFLKLCGSVHLLSIRVF